MFRVTERMGDVDLQRQLGRQQYEMLIKQRQASDGLRVRSASDDPVAAQALVGVNRDQVAAAGHEQNVARSLGRLDVLDDTLLSATDVLDEARVLGLQLANGTYSAEDRQTALTTVRGLRDELVALANVEDGDGYLLAGHRSDGPAYDATGAYLGDAGQTQVEVGAGQLQRIGLTGTEVFDPAGGQNAFAALDALEAALTANDATAIAGSVADLEQARQQVAQARGQVGYQQTALLRKVDELADHRLNLTERRSSLAEADSITALTELVEAQQALSSTLQVSSRMLNSLSLVNRL